MTIASVQSKNISSLIQKLETQLNNDRTAGKSGLANSVDSGKSTSAPLPATQQTQNDPLGALQTLLSGPSDLSSLVQSDPKLGPLLAQLLLALESEAPGQSTALESAIAKAINPNAGSTQGNNGRTAGAASLSSYVAPSQMGAGQPPTEVATDQRTARAKQIESSFPAGMSTHDKNLFMAMAMQETDNLEGGDASKSGGAANFGFMNFNQDMMNKLNVPQSQQDALKANPNDPAANIAVFNSMQSSLKASNPGNPQEAEAQMLAMQRGGIGVNPSDPEVQAYNQAITQTTNYLDKTPGAAFSGQRFAFNVDHI